MHKKAHRAAEDCLFEVFAGETAKNKFDNWLPDDTIEAFKEFLVGTKAADDAHRRRYLLAQRGAASDARPVCLLAPSPAFLCRSPFAREAPGKSGYGDLPREHRGHLAGIDTGGSPEAEDPDFVAKEFPKDFNKIRFGTSQRGEDTSNSRRPIIRRTARPFVSESASPVSAIGTIRLVKAPSIMRSGKKGEVSRRPQGQHHEIHGRRLPDWGYAAERTFGDKVYTGSRGADQEGQGRSRRNDEQKAALKAGVCRQGRHGASRCSRCHAPDELTSRHAQLERRLPFRRSMACGRHWHRARWQHHWCHWPCYFRSDHGTAPKYGKDMVNPGSVVLSGEMMPVTAGPKRRISS